MHIPKDRPWRARLLLPVSALLVLALLLYALVVGIGRLQAGFNSDDSGKLQVERVLRGDFEHRIAAFGELKSAERRSLVTQVAGTVTEVLLQPGSPVEPDGVILHLSNPQLQREYDTALLDVQEARANFEQLQAELSDQYLTLVSEEQMRRAELQTQEAELDARIILAEQNIVSQLELRKERMRKEQANLRYQRALERREAFQQTREVKLAAGQIRLQRAEHLLAMKQADLDALPVRAGMSGVLQSLNESIQLGQWLSQGATLGIVANLNALYAELRVSATDAAQVAVGMSVTINIKGYVAEGEVIRVAPNVVRNQVQVDVALTSDAPVTARPDMDVSADIILQRQTDTLLLPRPPHFESAHPLQLYVRQSGNQYRLTDVEVDVASNRQIAIRNGLSAGDEVLLADPVRWGHRPEIRFN